MKKVSLSGSLRENVGKKDAKQIRSEKKVPCVLYGGKEQIHFAVPDIDLDKAVFTPEVFRINIDLDGKSYDAVIKDIQFHPVTDAVLHCDFLELIDNKPVKIELPVRVTGNSIGVKNGGKLGINFRRIKVSGLPKDFPDAISLDITNLRIGQGVRVKEIDLPGVTILQNPQAVVVAVRRARGAIDELVAEEEEGAEEAVEAGEGAESES